jgi:hypothetical protein
VDSHNGWLFFYEGKKAKLTSLKVKESADEAKSLIVAIELRLVARPAKVCIFIINPTTVF